LDEPNAEFFDAETNGADVIAYDSVRARHANGNCSGRPAGRAFGSDLVSWSFKATRFDN
jgi:hypothetical protein